MKTQYTLYQWHNNKLIESNTISFPYFADNTLNIPEHIINMDSDHLTIRRTRINNNGDKASSIIESIYK